MVEVKIMKLAGISWKFTREWTAAFSCCRGLPDTFVERTSGGRIRTKWTLDFVLSPIIKSSVNQFGCNGEFIHFRIMYYQRDSLTKLIRHSQWYRGLFSVVRVQDANVLCSWPWALCVIRSYFTHYWLTRNSCFIVYHRQYYNWTVCSICTV